MEFVLGLAILVGIVYAAGGAVSRLLQNKSEAHAMAADLTLEGYAGLTPDMRLKRVATAADRTGAADRAAEFSACMGEFAATKSGELTFDDVFGWCDLQRVNNPAAFVDHFDELAAADLSVEALSVCEAMVKDRLAAPATAKFTFAEPTARGRQRYLVASNVDAQNTYGAMLRGRYVCEIQHRGGDPLILGNWNVHQLVIE